MYIKLPQRRKNRRVDGDPALAAVLSNPRLATRAARRSVGGRFPVWHLAMRAFFGDNLILPRAVRRGQFKLSDDLSTRRQRKLRARMARALARYGAHTA